jgi:hypothetical protein
MVTMSQKSSLPQPAKSVSRVLTADNLVNAIVEAACQARGKLVTVSINR